MIYDCFTFYNELDLLEIRLNELYDVVDKFVLVEAETSHQNKSKPLYFHENKNRYKKFLNKIIHIIVKSDEFVNNNTWYNEKLQRNRICDGLKDLTDNGLVIVSDLDEIPSKNGLNYAIKNNIFPAVFEQLYYYYYFNTPVFVNGSPYNYGSVILNKKIFIEDTEMGRKPIKHQWTIIPNGGWHFSFFGNSDGVFNKIQNYAHSEFSYLTKTQIENRFSTLTDPFGRINYNLKKIDDLNNLPEYVKNNLDKFQQYIKR